MRREKMLSIPILSVYDSLIADCVTDERDDVARLLKDCLEHPDLSEFGIDLPVPLVADIKVGADWGHTETLQI